MQPEGDLATKNDIAILKGDLAVHYERIENRIHLFEGRIENRGHQFEERIERLEERIERRFIETEFRLITRLGLLTVSSTSIAVAVLTWLIKI